MPVAIKTHQSYDEQLDLLRSRGMDVGPHENASTRSDVSTTTG